MPEAATPTGGAEVSARADASAPTSVHDRLKSALFSAPDTGDEETESHQAVARSDAPDTESVTPDETDVKEKPKAKAEGEEEPTEDAQTEQERVELSTLDDLAEALADQGYDLDRLMDLEAKVKIDGKEGKARLRDLIKSHQLEGHLNQKLMTHAEERKAFEVERSRLQSEQADKLLKLDSGLTTLQRALEGEFAQVDWQALKQDPSAFNAQYVAYEQRFAEMQRIGAEIAQERQQAQEQAARQAQAYLDEQKTLLQAKVPEWSDATRRDKDKAEISEYLKGHGISAEELESISDHRQILVIRDALNWAKLQKQKPAVLKKVKDAPRLLKPGSPQSRGTQEQLGRQKARLQLKKTGSVRDASPVLKSLLFG